MYKKLKLSSLTKEERENLIRKLYEKQSGKCFITGKDINLELVPKLRDGIDPPVFGD